MVSLVRLPAELQLSIIEHLDLTSTSFIPAPSEDLLSLSRVCKVLRALSLRFLLRSITLLNEEKSGSSVLTILHSPYAEQVRHVHYIGIKPMPEGPDYRSEAATAPSPDDFPMSVEQVLSSLSKLPNLERVTVQFTCAKTSEEDEDIYGESYDITERLESYEQVLEAEKTIAFRSLMERSYKALSHNPASSIKHLELKDVVAKECSAWHLADFHALLRGLSSFTISLRGGDNGAGWHINMVEGYLEFVSELHVYFFKHLSNTKHFSFAATCFGPPGIAGGMNNAPLPLLGQHMPQLQTLSLEHIFISEDLSTFITAHSDQLESVRLDHCYSGWDAEDAICWGDFFSSIVSKDMRLLKMFDIGPSDMEQMLPKDHDDYGYELAVRVQELLGKFPERRMLDYKHLDDKYGMLFDSEDAALERFEIGSDLTSWEQLCRTIKENLGDDS